MERGKATLDKTWLNFLIFQWGSTNLVFHGEESGRLTLMTPSSVNRAFLCPKCGTAAIASDLTIE
jgi:hypothetical protein